MRVQRDPTNPLRVPKQETAAARTPKAATNTTATVKNTPRDSFSAGTADVRDFSRYLQDQGNTNSCGTTSLAMMMSFWKGKPGAVTHNMIDQSIRYFDGPTAPTNIVSYLKSQGFRAEAKNNASVADLTKYLDQGVPVQVLYNPSADPSDVYLHYVDVVDYKKDAQGNVTSVKIADPGGGRMAEVPIEEFKKRWGNLAVKNVGIGANNLMIVALPGQNMQVRGKDGVMRNTDDIALPKGGNLGWKLGVIDVVADAANWVGKAAKKVGNFFKNLF
ncbi:MAG: C39 family peptidase [Myxococcales bacterium]